MVESNIKTDLDGLTEKLENLEENVNEKVAELNERELRWKKLDEEVENIRKNHNQIVKFNVSGEHFATRTDTLLRVKDTLFYKIVMTKKFDLSQEIFIDRSNKHFGLILNYLRYDRINYAKLSSDDFEELKTEADYYELIDVVNYLDERLREPVFVNFTFSGPYNSGGVTVGTNKLEDMADRNLNTGICANTPGWIIFELNQEFEISSVEVGGFTGNTSLWGASNGSGASIQTSTDNVSYSTVGSVPSTFSNSIVQVTLNKSKVKYIKVNHSSYLGLGYFKVFKSIN